MNTQVRAITSIQPNAKKKSFHRGNSTSFLVLRQDATLSEASSYRQHPSTLGHHCTFLTIVQFPLIKQEVRRLNQKKKLISDPLRAAGEVSKNEQK